MAIFDLLEGNSFVLPADVKAPKGPYHLLLAIREKRLMFDVNTEAGADAADALAVEDRSSSIAVRDGGLEQADRSESLEIGLRVLVDQRQAIVASSDTREATLSEMAERAVAMARLAPQDPALGLADPPALAETRDADALDLLAPADTATAAGLERMAREAEAAMLRVPGISKSDVVTAGAGTTYVHLAASNGFSGGYGRSGSGLSAVAISGSGLEMERDYCGESRVYLSDLPSPEEIGTKAAERALARAGARKPPTGAYPVSYDERIASGLIGQLLAAINGASVSRGASWLRDAMGEAVLPDGLDLIEDPLRPRIRSSKPFDAEGLPAVKRSIVEDGKLQRWLLDLRTARQLGLGSTGNASRGPGGPPSPSVSNVSLTQGERTQAELLSEMGEGLLITSMIGASINPTTGDYSRGASGFWVKNGEIAYPVNECTVAGNLRGMLRSIVPANDARPHLSRVVPSLLVEGLTIAGA